MRSSASASASPPRVATGGRSRSGLALVADDPLRESARRVLIRAHAGEGNLHEALVQYRAYRDVMREELDIDPSPQMEALASELGIGA